MIKSISSLLALVATISACATMSPTLAPAEPRLQIEHPISLPAATTAALRRVRAAPSPIRALESAEGVFSAARGLPPEATACGLLLEALQTATAEAVRRESPTIAAEACDVSLTAPPSEAGVSLQRYAVRLRVQRARAVQEGDDDLQNELTKMLRDVEALLDATQEATP